MRFPVSPLLVQVLFSDARAPSCGFHVVGSADFKGAVACGVIRGVTDSEEDVSIVPVCGMPNLRTEHPAAVRTEH
jgi:hypothetical protein